MNCPINYTRAYVALPLKLVCDPILPNNQGTYEPPHLSVPEGTLLNPTYPAACFWRLSAGMLVSELMLRVLSRIAPDRVPADSGSMPTWQFYVNGVRPNGEAFALHQHAFGGMGGRPGDDGLASVSFPNNAYRPVALPVLSVGVLQPDCRSTMVPSQSDLSCNVSEDPVDQAPAPPDSGERRTDSAREARRTARARWPVRKFRLEDAPGPDLSATTTAEERLAMMWPLACEAWSLTGRAIPDYPRDRMPVRIIRPASGDPVS